MYFRNDSFEKRSSLKGKPLLSTGLVSMKRENSEQTLFQNGGKIYVVILCFSMFNNAHFQLYSLAFALSMHEFCYICKAKSCRSAINHNLPQISRMFPQLMKHPMSETVDE